MTVAELIDKLKEMPQDAIVQIWLGYDSELEPVESVAMNDKDPKGVIIT